MEYISFGSKTMIKRTMITNITVCNDTVICSPCIKLLGSYLDQSLTISTHIMKKCSLAMWNLSCIQSINSYIDIDSLKTTVQALCVLHLDYSNALFYGLPTKDINCLQLVQNSCAKLVLGKNRYDSSTACLKLLHWLPVKFQIKFKILCLMHGVVNDSAPVYLHKMVKKKVFVDKPDVLLCLDHSTRSHWLGEEHSKIRHSLFQDQLSGTIFLSPSELLLPWTI